MKMKTLIITTNNFIRYLDILTLKADFKTTMSPGGWSQGSPST